MLVRGMRVECCGTRVDVLFVVKVVAVVDLDLVFVWGKGCHHT